MESVFRNQLDRLEGVKLTSNDVTCGRRAELFNYLTLNLIRDPDEPDT